MGAADRARIALVAGTVVAAVATAGSLWLSLGLGLTPCRLCWYQRILLYPLVVVLGVAAFEDRPGVLATAAPLAVAGAAVAAYHSWLQLTTTSCGFGTVSCAAVVWRSPVVGLTVPNLSLAAFLLILGALGAVYTASPGSTTSPASG